MREDLYHVLKDYEVKSKADGSFITLDSESQRFIDKNILDMETGGLKLPLKKRQQLIVL